MLMLALLAAATAPDSARAMTAAYESLCIGEDASPQAVLARADRSGWRRGGPDAPKDFDPASRRFVKTGDATLVLDVGDNVSVGERRTACSIYTVSPQPSLVADVQAMLGFSPALHIASSATFLALRENGAWKDGSKLSQAEFTTAKAAGKVYSLMVGDDGHNAMILSLRVRPDTGS